MTLTPDEIEDITWLASGGAEALLAGAQAAYAGARPERRRAG